MVDGVDHQLMGDEQDRLGVGVGDALLVQFGRRSSAPSRCSSADPCAWSISRSGCRAGTAPTGGSAGTAGRRPGRRRDDDGTAERIRGITIDVTDRPGVRTVGYLGRVRGAGGVGSTGSVPEPHRHVLARELLHAPQNPPIPVRVTPEARNRRAGWAPVFSARRDEAVVPRIGHGRRYGETTVWQCTAAWSSGLGPAGGAWCVCVVGSGGPDRPDRFAGGRRAQARRGADEPGGSDDRGR